jgi:16S rRNA (uracil1498-N3)-methyltransferase
MARRFFANPLPPPGLATLSRKLGHHLGRIVRTSPGDSVVLFDGAGNEVAATIREVHSREVLVDVSLPIENPLGRSPRIHLEVACALPRSARADWLLEHGTEAGVSTFRPLLTERTNRRHEDRAHWDRVLIEACSQCDRAILPTVAATVSLADLCAAPRIAERYVATAAAVELSAAVSSECLLVVGPEGGFSEREVEMLVESGFAPRSLGPLTLRTETAVVAGATRLLQAKT